jgi:hypothetical protein
MATSPYKRLPGTGGHMMNRASLWETDDHLLLVNGHLVSESYRRFYFRDIQAFTVCETKGGLWRTLIIGIFAVLLAVPAFFLPTAGAVVFGGLALVFAVVAGVNALRGPTCLCKIHTAVQMQELPSLNRLRSARQVLNSLAPKILQAQATEGQVP